MWFSKTALVKPSQRHYSVAAERRPAWQVERLAEAIVGADESASALHANTGWCIHGA